MADSCVTLHVVRCRYCAEGQVCLGRASLLLAPLLALPRPRPHPPCSTTPFEPTQLWLLR